MKKLVYFFALAALVFSFTMTSCSNNDPVIEKDEVDNLIDKGELKGMLDHNVTLDGTKTYILTGTFIIKNGASLTIPAGTTIKANEGFDKYIMTEQGGKIFVNGTAAKPVTMTANTATPKSGFWGGLVLNGRAKISGPAGTVATSSCEMDANYKYGGNDDADSSGSITYLKIMYAGARSSSEVEHNGLTLDAVGNGTKIENVFILESADDGIEFFGGSVNVKNLLVVNSDDDMFDNTQGYTGTWENVYGIWTKGYSSSESDPRAIESDGNLDGKTPTDINQTNFTVKNMTVELNLDYNTASQNTFMQDVIKVRRGATANITNSLVKGIGAVQDLVDTGDKAGAGNVASVIKLTSLLSNSITGKPFNAGKDADGNTLAYPNVKIQSEDTGCDKAVFGWTGYAF